jgi:hypothetical protein
MSDRPTPETDNVSTAGPGWMNRALLMAIHARRLERERDEEREQLTESRAQAERLAEALQCQQDAEEWIENADPESAFFEATMSLMLNSAADMRKEALAVYRAAKGNCAHPESTPHP